VTPASSSRSRMIGHGPESKMPYPHRPFVVIPPDVPDMR